jgi:hypothetical protein
VIRIEPRNTKIDSMRLSYLGAPVLVLTYGVLRIIDGLDGVRGPGPAWTMGHVAFLLALFFWVPVTLDLRRRLGGGPASTAFTVVAGVGAAALTAQFVIDIVAGLRAADHAAMSAQLQQVRSIPGVMPAVYAVGPSLFYLGMSALVIHLAVTRQVRAWVPVVFTAGTLLPLVDKDLLPLGALCLLAASVPLVTRSSPARARTRQESRS